MAKKPPLDQIREDARKCQDCPLWANATQTVFGAGDPHARVMLVGEQPGDEEDKKGLPFVGPAGRLLNRALEAAGVDREHLYVTNAVKHFKWQLRGKRRLHKTPAQREVDACHQWLEREIAARGEELANEVHEDRLARAFSMVVNFLDPDVIVLGGGLSNIERFYTTVPRLLPKYVYSQSFDTPIVRARHGDASGVRGAAMLWPR